MNELYNELSTEMQKTIDHDLICKLFESQGWSRVEIPCATDTKYVEVLDWVKNNTRHKWRGRYEAWVFESVEDATLFKMVWSS